MLQVNMFEAKSDLSRLVRLLETKQEDVIYIARNGNEVAQLTLIPSPLDAARRIGVAKGKIVLPVGFDSEAWNDEVSNLFEGEGAME